MSCAHRWATLPQFTSPVCLDCGAYAPHDLGRFESWRRVADAWAAEPQAEPVELPSCEDCQAATASEVDTRRDRFVCRSCADRYRPGCDGCGEPIELELGKLCRYCLDPELAAREAWDALTSEEQERELNERCPRSE